MRLISEVENRANALFTRFYAAQRVSPGLCLLINSGIKHFKLEIRDGCVPAQEALLVGFYSGDVSESTHLEAFKMALLALDAKGYK